MAHTVVLDGGVGFCNAVRRAMLNDLVAWAPYEVLVRENTSCETDEYLAHRLGLLPVRRTGNGAEMRLSAKGPATVRASALGGSAFECLHGDAVVMELDSGQEIDVVVRYDQQRGAKHARYAGVAAVGMEKVDRTRHRIRYEVIDDRTPASVVEDALDALDAYVDRALHSLAHQPDVPPKSMC